MHPGQLQRLASALQSPMRIQAEPASTGDGPLVVTVRCGDGCSPRLEVCSRPVPRIHCGCRDSQLHTYHCQHACWLLLHYGGVSDVRVLDTPAQEAIARAAHNLRKLGAGARGRPDVSPPEAGSECPVCLAACGAGACVDCTACRTVYHRACAVRWGSVPGGGSCPTCRDPQQFADL